MPHAIGFQVLVELLQAPKKTESGLFLPPKEVDRENAAGQIAYIKELGPRAYKGLKSASEDGESWVNVGDLVYIVPYSGRRFKMKDPERHVRLIHDEDILGLVDKEEDDWEVCLI